jgi:hypothetical protein
VPWAKGKPSPDYVCFVGRDASTAWDRPSDDPTSFSMTF